MIQAKKLFGGTLRAGLFAAIPRGAEFPLLSLAVAVSINNWCV